MAITHELKTSLGFDTEVFRKCGKEYAEIAANLRTMSKELDDCLTDLKNDGWTTEAGSAFQKLVDTSWRKNIEKYASLLVTLESILIEAAKEYDNLVDEHIEKTKL